MYERRWIESYSDEKVEMAAAVDPAENTRIINGVSYKINTSINVPTSNKFTFRVLKSNKSTNQIIGKKAKKNGDKKFVKKERNILSDLEPCKEQIAHLRNYNNSTNELFTNYKADGDLFDYIKLNIKNKTLTETNAINIFINVCKAVNCLHTKGFYHLDLKFENVLIKKNPDGTIMVFLTDFETTQQSLHPPICILNKEHPVIGTFGYTLDWILVYLEFPHKNTDELQFNGFHQDLYSLCVMLYILLISCKNSNIVYLTILLKMLNTAISSNPIHKQPMSNELYRNLNEIIAEFEKNYKVQSNNTQPPEPTLDTIEDILITGQINIGIAKYIKKHAKYLNKHKNILQLIQSTYMIIFIKKHIINATKIAFLLNIKKQEEFVFWYIEEKIRMQAANAQKAANAQRAAQALIVSSNTTDGAKQPNAAQPSRGGNRKTHNKRKMYARHQRKASTHSKKQ